VAIEIQEIAQLRESSRISESQRAAVGQKRALELTDSESSHSRCAVSLDLVSWSQWDVQGSANAIR